MSQKDVRSSKESPLLRTKSTKPKPIKAEFPKIPGVDGCGAINSAGQSLDSAFLCYGRSGRRNTLPNLFPDETGGIVLNADKQNAHQDLEKQAHDNLPFLDSFIKKKNKFRQSFHGSLSSSSSKLVLRHTNSGLRKSVVGAIIAGSASCDSSPFMKRANSPARGKGREKQRSLECSRPSTPSEEESSSAGSLPRSTSEGMGSLCEEAATGTMEGLARQALLAARVFNLIPVEKARERNYLHGRIASMSLLGALELEKVLPKRDITIFVATWNMNGQAPPHDVNDLLLPAELEHVPDILAIATQESYPERFEWEVRLQETVGPSHVLFHSAVLGTLHLGILMRRDLLWFCSIPEEANVSTRTAAAFRTKGAVAIGFLLFGTSLLFICSHLTAHAEKVKERIHDARRIIGSLELPKQLPVRHRSKDATKNYDCVFWCGDLNFRLDHNREDVINWATCEQAFPADGPLILDGDQLKQVMAEGAAFHDFLEGPIMFPPTYKYDPGTDNFDSSSKRRTPAYTDRILFRSRTSGDLNCEKYSSAPQVMTSDHKPVWGLYKTKLRPGKDTIPLAAGQFNRDVYLEGMKRRATAMDRRQGLSTVCSLQ